MFIFPVPCPQFIYTRYNLRISINIIYIILIGTCENCGDDLSPILVPKSKSVPNFDFFLGPTLIYYLLTM